MAAEDLAPGPHASQPHPEHTVYPCLLRNLTLSHSNLVWSAEFCFAPIPIDFIYPVAVIDWHSRYVPACGYPTSSVLAFICRHRIANCFLLALYLQQSQCSPCSSGDFADRLFISQIQTRKYDRDWALDSVCAARLWRSVKYKDI